MKVTVTGASGLIGRRVVKFLTAANHSVHVLSRSAGEAPAGVRISEIGRASCRGRV